MTIHVEDLKFQCIIGILDFERVTPQDLIVNLSLEYNFQDEFINYVDLIDIIKSHILEGKFLLIEDALNSLNKELNKNFPLIRKLNLKLTKPSILPNCKVSVSNLYLFES
jgi:dihydroneopterin aldolase